MRRHYRECALKLTKLLPATNSEIEELVVAAFMLRAHDDIEPERIVSWLWPFEVLSRGAEFTGLEPWSILLREAQKIAITLAVLGE